MSLSVLSSCELGAAAEDMCHGLCMLLAQPAFWILHSVVDLVCHCPELAPQSLSHSVYVLRGGFAAYLFVIVAECLQDSKVFVALVYVIYLTLW